MNKEIRLSEAEQLYLKDFVKNGSHKSKEIIRARVLLMLDRTGKVDHVRYNRTAEYAGISVQAVYNMRDEYLENQDIAAYLTRKKRTTPPVKAKVTGEVEAKIVALACSKAPDGRSRWTLRLLAEKAVELHIIDRISYVRVQQILKKTKYKPHLKKMWCIPPKQNAEFVAHMEDVLEVYSRPFDQKRPVICMDEKPFQLLDEYLEPISMGKDNHSEKYDCEYVRKGSCAIFMFTEPLGGWREAHAYPRRTACDWALQLKWLVDESYADADKIVLVMDNLNTHTTASLYKAFPPEEAYRIAQKLEIHYTPKHGSWLDMAEIELSALTVQCLLNVRIPTIEDLNKILSAWSQKRNFAQKGVSWHFTTDDARIKLSHLYPEIKF